MSWKRFRPSPALVLAMVALFVASATTGYAQVRLARNSVTSIHVKDRSLLAKDFRRGQLPRGAQGPIGPQGPAGAQGPAGPAGSSGSANIRWAAVRADGGIAASSGGITLAAKPGAGQYLLAFGSAVAGKLILSSSGYAGNHGDSRGETSAGPCGNPADGLTCSASNTDQTVLVQTRSVAGALEDHPFYVAVVG
jgi:hypothetical protein